MQSGLTVVTRGPLLISQRLAHIQTILRWSSWRSRVSVSQVRREFDLRHTLVLQLLYLVAPLGPHSSASTRPCFEFARPLGWPLPAEPALAMPRTWPQLLAERRDVVTLLGGGAAAWPLAVRAESCSLERLFRLVRALGSDVEIKV
jgi:hypothetical protein